MPNIVVLDENMINLIAAGEVIERPASVVKELLENSIDAGATDITVRIEDGGRKLIAVTDNGSGMDADDLQVAFEPHATSKIKTPADLAQIATMGFRGEALASIASVAQVRAVTRKKDSLQANCIEIDCGKKNAVKPCSGDYGATIEIRDLFYKLPARKKFLRTANTEMTHIVEHFTRIALANTNLGMTLVHNGKEIYRLTPHQTLHQRIALLLSKPLAEDLIEIESSEKNLHIYGLTGTPAAARANNRFQYIFLNHRFIRDKSISHSVKEAYRGLTEPDKYPVMFLFLDMPADSYDVNVHPTKIEVRFDNPNLVYSQILGVLREKLLSLDLGVPARLPDSGFAGQNRYSEVSPDRHRMRITEAMAEFFQKNKPDQTAQRFLDFPRQTAASGRQSENPSAILPEFFGPPPKFLQVHNSYIITQTDEGFLIIDQHALHERIIYEDLCKKIIADKLESQRLLIPESFEITDSQLDQIRTHSELFGKIGIELEPFGPRTMAIQSFPTMLLNLNHIDFVQQALDLMADKGSSLDAERLLHEILDMAACKAAVKAGQKLSEIEMQQLLTDKDTIERASRCPHGRPTTLKFSLAELQKQFKRT